MTDCPHIDDHLAISDEQVLCLGCDKIWVDRQAVLLALRMVFADHDPEGTDWDQRAERLLAEVASNAGLDGENPSIFPEGATQ